MSRIFSLKQLALSLTLSVAQLFATSASASAVDLYKGDLTSHINGQPDCFGVAAPEGKKHADMMFLYLHGAGCDFTEAFKPSPLYPHGLAMSEALMQAYPGAIVVSPNYGTVSWGNDGALADIDEVISRVSKDYGVEHILIVGNSMGASVAFVYAAHAPAEIRNKLVGIVAAQPASDLAELYRTTSQPFLPDTLCTALGGGPDQCADVYTRKSVKSALSKLPKNCRVAIIAAKSDTIVPYSLQSQVVALLQNQGIKNKVIALNGSHGCQTAGDFMTAVRFVEPQAEEKHSSGNVVAGKAQTVY